MFGNNELNILFMLNMMMMIFIHLPKKILFRKHNTTKTKITYTPLTAFLSRAIRSKAAVDQDLNPEGVYSGPGPPDALLPIVRVKGCEGHNLLPEGPRLLQSGLGGGAPTQLPDRAEKAWLNAEGAGWACSAHRWLTKWKGLLCRGDFGQSSKR